MFEVAKEMKKHEFGMYESVAVWIGIGSWVLRPVWTAV